jgi:triosephosphate isomerase (TIM)
MAHKIVAGNWKMNLNRDEAFALVSEITGMFKDEESRDLKVILFPSFIHLGAVVQLCAGDSRIHIGAQNCSEHSSGAFTGEIGVSMIKSYGGTHVLVGHSERRSYFNESGKTLSQKIKLVITQNLTPVFCIGESLDERNAGKHFEIIEQQLTKEIFDLSSEDFKKCILAYEPVWAIGTGLTASPEQAQEMHSFIRSVIQKKYSNEVAQQTSILYGGSCNDQNAKEIFSLPDVDGGLIGGASLKSRSFVNIIKSLP